MPPALSTGVRPHPGRLARRIAAATLAAVAILPAGPALAATDAKAHSRLSARPASADRLREPGIVADVPEGVSAPPQLPAASYLLADLDSGAVLVAKGAHVTRGPASTLKLLTAQTVAPRIAQDAVIRAARSDAAVDGTKVGMVPDVDYTFEQLFQAMVMQSANDASEALARSNGSMTQTVAQMNERAAQLGAKDTVAATPHGLDAPGQQSTAYDLVAILRGALATPKVAEVLTLRTATFPGGAKPAFQIASQNKLLWNYDGAVGGKDGFTDAAGHTYVGAVRRGDKTYAVAFMGAQSNDWRPAGKLLDWAFTHGAAARPIGTLPPAVPPVDPQGSAAAVGPAGGAVVAAESSPAVSAARDEGFLAGAARAVVMLLKVLLWTIAVLGVLAVALRVRKLRRDARREQERRARPAVAHSTAEPLAEAEVSPHVEVIFDRATPRSPRMPDPVQPRPSRVRSKQRTGPH